MTPVHNNTTSNLFNEAEAMNDSQIDKPSDNLRAGIIKIVTQFSAEHIKEVLENGQLDARINFAIGTIIGEIISDLANTVIQVVPRLDRSRTLQQICGDTGYRPNVDSSVLETIPPGGTDIEENVVVVFFRPGRCLNAAELEREYDSRGLVPDPVALIAVNVADPNFARDYPNGTQWGRNGQEASYITFQHWPFEPQMYICRSGNAWGPDWWFAGVRKK